MPGSGDLWIPRFLFQRGMGMIYCIAFLVAVNQFRPLLGEHGLLPVPLFVKRAAFADSPSLFFFAPRDWAFTSGAWVGLALAVFALSGYSERFGTPVSMAVWGALWLLYISFVNVGQTFYAFGWETMTLEAGFCAIFLGAASSMPGALPMWVLRWMEFRVMFGAGLIKLRGDPCWRELTCLDYHYETQPIPNPLSWYFDRLPRWTLHGGVAFNHFVEIVVPFGFLLPQPFASVAACITILFQLMLMLSGNLSFLNLLTIVIALPMLDGKWLMRWLPVTPPAALEEPARWFEIAVTGYLAVVLLLSIRPTVNLLSNRQLMNASFEPLHLVNTYGAFGSVGRVRDEVIVEGTGAATPSEYADWRAYEFKGKPGDPMRRPPQTAPYHLRLDWQMWFAAMSNYTDEPWFVNFVAKLLEGDRDVLSLLRANPFSQAPPKYVRARLYRYRFSTAEERKRTGAWWQREFERVWFPPISLDTPGFEKLLREQGWR
jgi:hypothetical protein